jgi:hypothetical protein
MLLGRTFPSREFDQEKQPITLHEAGMDCDTFIHLLLRPELGVNVELLAVDYT